MPLPLKAGYNFNYAHVHRPPCFEMTSAEAYTDFYGLSYLISGENLVYSPAGTFILREGDMDFMLKNRYFRSSCISDKPREGILIKFTDSMVADLLAIMGVDSLDTLIGEQYTIHLDSDAQKKVLSILLEMEHEWNAYNKHSEIILKGLLHKLILIFLNERSKKGVLELPNSNKKQACLTNGERFKFCVNSKSDIRYVNSFKWAEPIFLVLPLSVLYRDFYCCQCTSRKIPSYRFLSERRSSKYISNWEWI